MLDLTEPCILARRRVAKDGYAYVGHKSRSAHRDAYTAAYGPIPKGLQIGHKCHDLAAVRGECLGGPCLHRRCINPAHLLAETSSANIMASPFTSQRRMQARTHCPEGHALSPDNLMKSNLRQGSRVCVTCHRERGRMRRDARRAVA